MRKIKNISMLVVVLMTSVMAQAQISVDDMLKLRCAEKVKQMCDYIENMGNPQMKYNNRLYYKKAGLNLFVGKGYSYEEDGITKQGVTMEVTSLNTSRVSRPFMRDYFDRLINRKSYSKVVVQTTDVAAMKVSQLQQVDNDTYVCTVYFEQSFCGYRDGKPIYRDITRKRVKCYVKVDQTEDGTEYIVLLGDVTATDTRPYED